MTETRKMCGANLRLIADSASSAKWVENLAENNGGIWIKDEIGQYLKAINQQECNLETKEYFLAAYDGSLISRNKKQMSITIENPRLVILSYTVDQTWSSNVPAESMLDGFAQRFN